jgi:hypothetical protein
VNTKTDEDKILRDGESLRTSMTMMDAQQIAVADALQPKPFVADHHRPNSAILTDAEKKAADERHAARDKRLSDAWKNPEPLYVPVTDGKAAREDTSITAEPRFGPAAGNVEELDAIQVANQQRYNARIESAWKTPTNAGAK